MSTLELRPDLDPAVYEKRQRAHAAQGSTFSATEMRALDPLVMGKAAFGWVFTCVFVGFLAGMPNKRLERAVPLGRSPRSGARVG